MANRFIIACAGRAERWGNYTGVPKHLVQIDGKPLLHHTVETLQARGANDIVIMAKVPGYAVAGAQTVDPTTSALEETALGHSAAYWTSDSTRTTVLFGDVYFSPAAMDAIFRERGSLTWFGRRGKGKSGSPYGELFGLTFDGPGQLVLRKAFRTVTAAKMQRRITRAGGWECYRQIHSLPLKIQRITTDFVEINDETEDFDRPEEYDMWLRAFRP